MTAEQMEAEVTTWQDIAGKWQDQCQKMVDGVEAIERISRNREGYINTLRVAEINKMAKHTLEEAA